VFGKQINKTRLIPPKYKRPIAALQSFILTTQKYGYALCEKTFKTEQKLSHHVASAHLHQEPQQQQEKSGGD
jgi:hypothetical protein